MRRIAADIVEGIDSFVYEWGVGGMFVVALWVGAIILAGITVAHA